MFLTQEHQAHTKVDQHNSMQASTSFGTANSISHQFPGGFDPNASFYDDGSCGQLNYSQEEGMSYMDMLLGVQKSADARNYKDFQQGPLGDENKLFMITGRYSDGNDNMLEDEEPFEQFHENSMQTSDTFHEEDSSHFDNSTTQNEENSDAEWDDLAPKEYDIFGDGRKDTSVDQEPNASTDQQPIHSNDHPACASTEGNNTESQEPVKHLSQQDIEDFLVHDNIETCSQEVRRQHTPHLDMMFDSDEQAYHFYNEYAGICGFSVKKAGTYHARKAGSTGHTRATFLCNKSGKIIDRETLEAKKKRKQERKQERTGVVPAETQKRRRANIVDITGCLAKMVVSLKNGKWVVISVDLEHNHQLSPPDETKFLRSHKHMTEQEKLFIRTFNSVKLPTRKIMAILAYLRGGVGALPYTKKYVSKIHNQ